MYGPTCIVWANLTPSPLQSAFEQQTKDVAGQVDRLLREVKRLTRLSLVAPSEPGLDYGRGPEARELPRVEDSPSSPSSPGREDGSLAALRKYLDETKAAAARQVEGTAQAAAGAAAFALQHLDRERGATVAAISELEAQLSSPGVAERVW